MYTVLEIPPPCASCRGQSRAQPPDDTLGETNQKHTEGVTYIYICVCV